jgi:ABC-type nickel/cobalt efflux system permease component RcnA
MFIQTDQPHLYLNIEGRTKMKPSTKNTLVGIASLLLAAGAGAYYIWSYKQDQIDVIKAKEHELDRARAMVDATGLVKKQREHIEELQTRIAEMKKTSVINIAVSAKDLRSAKKARKVMEEALAEMKEKQSHTHTYNI